MKDYQIRCGFSPLLFSRDSKPFLAPKITAIVLGVLGVIVAALVLSGVPQISNLGNSAGWVFLGTGIGILLLGWVIHCMKSSAQKTVIMDPLASESDQNLKIDEEITLENLPIFKRKLREDYEKLIQDLETAYPAFMQKVPKRSKDEEVTKDSIPQDFFHCYLNTYASPDVESLDQLLENPEYIEKIYGNSSLKEAQVIILADQCHSDQRIEEMIEKVIFNLINPGDIYLAEGAESLHKCLPQESHWIHDKKVELLGWDDLEDVEISLIFIDLCFTRLTLLENKSTFPEVDRDFGNKIKNLRDFSLKLDDFRNLKRNACLDQTLRTLASKWPGKRIFVAAGSAHVEEEDLKMRLSDLKYCVVMPAEGPTKWTPEDLLKHC